MGHKVSAVHGVKSDNFYNPGNAINEIWTGNVELISRLPFGDSDLEQAGWPIKGYPKIPWHNFIIPLKRRTLSAVESLTEQSHNQITAISERDQWRKEMLGDLSRNAVPLFVAYTFLFTAAFAYHVPAYVRRETPPPPDLAILPQRKKLYKKRLCMAMGWFLWAVIWTIVDYAIFMRVRQPADFSGPLLLAGLIFWAWMAASGSWKSTGAIISLWKDWREVCRAEDEESVGVSSDFVDEKLPLILASWCGRQRRP